METVLVRISDPVQDASINASQTALPLKNYEIICNLYRLSTALLIIKIPEMEIEYLNTIFIVCSTPFFWLEPHQNDGSKSKSL